MARQLFNLKVNNHSNNQLQQNLFISYSLVNSLQKYFICLNMILLL